MDDFQREIPPPGRAKESSYVVNGNSQSGERRKKGKKPNIKAKRMPNGGWCVWDGPKMSSFVLRER